MNFTASLSDSTKSMPEFLLQLTFTCQFPQKACQSCNYFESMDKFGNSWYLNNTEPSNPRAYFLSPYILVFFNFLEIFCSFRCKGLAHILLNLPLNIVWFWGAMISGISIFFNSLWLVYRNAVSSYIDHTFWNVVEFPYYSRHRWLFPDLIGKVFHVCQ